MTLFFALATAYASGGGGHEAGHGGIPTTTLVYTAINLLLFIGLMVWFTRRPISDALKNRALDVRAGLDTAAKLQRDAEGRFAEVEQKLAALGQQVESLKAEAQADANREAEVLGRRAEADATRLHDAAVRTIREETVRSTNLIRGEAATLAVNLAKEVLRREATAEDQERLARAFLAAVRQEEQHD